MKQVLLQGHAGPHWTGSSCFLGTHSWGWVQAKVALLGAL